MKVKLNKKAHQDATGLLVETKHMANLVPEKREPENEVEHMADENYVIFPE